MSAVKSNLTKKIKGLIICKFKLIVKFSQSFIDITTTHLSLRSSYLVFIMIPVKFDMEHLSRLNTYLFNELPGKFFFY
jgi:hypothetical protein